MSGSRQPADDKWAHFGDPLKVPVDVDDAELVMERGTRDEQVGYGRAVPHPVVVSQVSLEIEHAIEHVSRCGNDRKGLAQVGREGVVVSR